MKPIIANEEQIVLDSTRTKVTELMITASRLKLKNIEDLCQTALEHISGRKDPARKHDNYNSRAMIQAGLPLLDINFNLRFQRKWDPKEKKSIFNNIFGGTNVNPYDYESVVNEDILNAPIMDICIIQKNEVVPEGFFRLTRTPSGKRADLNTGSGGHHLYFCIKKMMYTNTPPITSLVVIYPDKKEYVPPGFSVVKRGGKPCNINSGTSSERIFLCYKRDNACNPIIDLQIYFPTKNETLPSSFSKLTRSIRNYPVDLNMGTGAQPISICFKYSISNLDCLIADPYPGYSHSNSPRFPTSTKHANNNNNKDGNSNNNHKDGIAISNTTPTTIQQQHHQQQQAIIHSEVNNVDLSEDWEYEKHSRNVNNTISNEKDTTSPTRPPQPPSSSSSSNYVSPPREVKRSSSAPDEKPISTDRDFSLDRPLSVPGDLNKLSPEGLNTNTTSASAPNNNNNNNNELPPPQQQQQQSSTSTSTSLNSSQNPQSSDSIDENNSNNNNKSNRRGSTQVDDDNINGDNNEIEEIEQKPEIIADVMADEESGSVGGHDNDQDDIQNLRTTRIVTINDELIPRVYGHVLRAILAALFTTGEMFESTLDTLNVLLLEDTLFKTDFLGHPSNESNITMLDLTVCILCERLDCSIEVVNNTILQVLNRVILKSQGRISKFCVQKIFRATTFVATAYSTRGTWVTSGQPEPVQDDGQEIFAFIVLKELIKHITALAEDCEIDHTLPISQIYFVPNANRDDLSLLTEAGKEITESCYSIDHLLSKGESYVIVCDIVMEFFDEVMDAVETSRVTEVALLAVAKKTSSTLSPSFWSQMNTISQSLFKSYQVQTSFILLAALCKWSWLGIKTNETGEAAPRHLGNKLLAIESLREFCRVAGSRLRVSKIMGYQIRRIVVSLIISNMQYSTIEPRIFSKLLKLISVLWENWREHIRLEFPMLCQQLILKILHAPTVKLPPILHIITLKEIVKWFDQPHMLVEMFVNFDMDAVVAADWNIFAHIIRAICLFAEKSSRPNIPGNLPGPYSSETSLVGSSATMFGTNCLPIHPRDVKIKALEVVTSITRAIMDATGHANLIYMDIIANDSNVMNRGWISKNIDDMIEGEQDAFKRRSYTLKNKREATLQTAELLQQAISIYKEKESVGKAVKFLISKNFMSDTPHEIAGFVRIYKDSFDPVTIGDFLGEGGRNKQEEEYWDMIRYRFTRAVSFVDMEVDDALRLYLTGCGFRMPGEAQKIDRFISAFVKVFWQDNNGTEFCPFHHEDTVHLLAYATIMLNTDLHRANIDKKKGGKKMTKVDFIKNLRGADQGNDINSDYLGHIYDNIATTPIEMEVKSPNDNNGNNNNNSNNNNNNGNNNSTGNNSNNNIIGSNKLNEREIITTDPESYKRFIADLLRNLRNTEDLMRSLSPYNHKFAIMGIDISISMELVSFMFEAVWHNFHAIVDGILTKLNNEEHVIFNALDILCNSLTSCIFLDLKVEKLAFATQLARFRHICTAAMEVDDNNSSGNALTAATSSLLSNFKNLSESVGSKSTTSSSSSTTTTTSNNNSLGGGGGGGNSNINKVGGANFASGNFRKEKWFISVEQSSAETAITAIAEVHTVVSQIKDMIKQLARREATKQVFSKIEKKANLKDGIRFFVMEGDLKKKNRQGKYDAYHFFLFSDILIYTHQGFSEYKVHGQLELETTTIDPNVREDVTNCCFIVNNPVKSFVAMAESSIEKQNWVRILNEVITSCQVRRRGRRLSILDRMQSQEKEVTERQYLHENLGLGSRASRPASFRATTLLTKPTEQTSTQVEGDEVRYTSSPIAIKSDDDMLSPELVQQKHPFQINEVDETIENNTTNTNDNNNNTNSNSNNNEEEKKKDDLNNKSLNNDNGNGNNDHNSIDDYEDNNSNIDEHEKGIDHHDRNDPMLVDYHTPIKSPNVVKTEENDENFTSPEGKAISCHSPDHSNLERKRLSLRDPHSKLGLNSSLNTQSNSFQDVEVVSQKVKQINEDKEEGEDDDEDEDEDEDHSPLQLCSVYLTSLNENDLQTVFEKASETWKHLLDTKDPLMTEHYQYKLYGLYKTGKDGSIPADLSEVSEGNDRDSIPSLSTNVNQRHSWKDSSTFRQVEAQKLFILTLLTVYSEFNYRLE